MEVYMAYFSEVKETLLSIFEYIDNFDTNFEYSKVKSKSDFIEEMFNVLDSSSIVEKKKFYIENQDNITDVIEDIKDLYQRLDSIEQPDVNINRASQLLFTLSGSISRLIFSLKKEMVEEVSQANGNDQILITNDNVNEVKDNIEEQSQGEKLSSQEISNLLNALNATNNNHHVQNQNQNIERYLITSQDFSEMKILPGVNLSISVLNKMLERCGFDNPRIFTLTEIPTQQRIVQKRVTVIPDPNQQPQRIILHNTGCNPERSIPVEFVSSHKRGINNEQT